MSTSTFRHSPLFRYITFSVLTAFGFFPVTPSYAQVAITMTPPGQMIHITQHFEPPQLLGLKIDLKNPFSFDFIMDRGENSMPDDVKKQEFNKIIKYFLVALAMPNDDMWVNLSPYESKRIIPPVFAQTEMGRDLLSQDYTLKQFTASLMYPEDGLGKKFWQTVYAQAQARFGTTQINVNTFNKVWIVADHADVYQKDDTAFLVASHLKVMLEQDYKALTMNQEQFGEPQAVSTDETENAKTRMASDLVRQIIIPAIEKEVNEGASFAGVRQIYNAQIMATWFKRTLRESLLGEVFADKAKIAGQRVNDPKVMDKIYHQYLMAYKMGVFDYIKKDITPDGQTIPRKYFSGGYKTLQEFERGIPFQSQVLKTITPATLPTLPPASRAMVIQEVNDFAQAVIPEVNERLFDANVSLRPANTNIAFAPVAVPATNLPNTPPVTTDASAAMIHQIAFSSAGLTPELRQIITRVLTRYDVPFADQHRFLDTLATEVITSNDDFNRVVSESRYLPQPFRDRVLGTNVKQEDPIIRELYGLGNWNKNTPQTPNPNLDFGWRIYFNQITVPANKMHRGFENLHLDQKNEPLAGANSLIALRDRMEAFADFIARNQPYHSQMTSTAHGPAYQLVNQRFRSIFNHLNEDIEKLNEEITKRSLKYGSISWVTNVLHIEPRGNKVIDLKAIQGSEPFAQKVSEAFPRVEYPFMRNEFDTTEGAWSLISKQLKKEIGLDNFDLAYVKGWINLQPVHKNDRTGKVEFRVSMREEYPYFPTRFRLLVNKDDYHKLESALGRIARFTPSTALSTNGQIKLLRINLAPKSNGGVLTEEAIRNAIGNLIQNHFGVVPYHDGSLNLFADEAMRTATLPGALKDFGGINLSDENLKLNIKLDGAGMPLPAQYQDRAMMNLNGLSSVINKITPLTPNNVPALYHLLKE